MLHLPPCSAPLILYTSYWKLIVLSLTRVYILLEKGRLYKIYGYNVGVRVKCENQSL